MGIVLAFFIGSIPNGVIVGKLYGRIDIRKHGSGNIGATNAVRQMGWGGGTLVFVLDFLKGLLGTLSMLLILRFGLGLTGGWAYDWGMGLSLLATSCGHMFSPWLGFKGGKGITTSWGGFWLVSPWCGVTSIIAFAVFAIPTKRVSIGSIAGDVAYLLTTLIVYNSHVPLVIVSIVLFLIVLWAHRGNIDRLAHDEEAEFHAGSRETLEKARAEERGEDTAAASARGEAAMETEGSGDAVGCAARAGAEDAPPCEAAGGQDVREPRAGKKADGKGAKAPSGQTVQAGEDI